MSTPDQLPQAVANLFPQVGYDENYATMGTLLQQDPSLRYRLRGALSSLDIEPSRSLDLGYSKRPFIDMNGVCENLGLPVDPKSDRGEIVGMAILEGAMELRSDMAATLDLEKRAKTEGLKTLKILPTFLQYFAAFKAIDSLHLSYGLSTEEDRARLSGYFAEHLGASELASEDILQSASIVYADRLIGADLREDSKSEIAVTGVDRAILLGPVNPERGLHMGYDLETAVSERLRFILGSVSVNAFLATELPKWLTNDGGRDLTAYREFWPKVRKILEHGVDLSDLPEDEREQWESYLFATAAIRDAFKPNTSSGFHGGLDQLVSWKEPVHDGEYDARMGRADLWLKAAAVQGLDIHGANLARQALAFDIVDHIESEIVTGTSMPRSNRLYVLVHLIKTIGEADPELADVVIERCPLLKNTIFSRMDPWGFKYGHKLSGI